jgi:hypothetical protein
MDFIVRRIALGEFLDHVLGHLSDTNASAYLGSTDLDLSPWAQDGHTFGHDLGCAHVPVEHHRAGHADALHLSRSFVIPSRDTLPLSRCHQTPASRLRSKETLTKRVTRRSREAGRATGVGEVTSCALACSFLQDARLLP